MIKEQESSGLVSVILPVFNAEMYLKESVESILNQTYANFELLVIDDGSIDGSLNILQEYADSDSRLRLISRENKGLVETLNEAIALAKGEYIARMDADDISLPHRFEKQVAYLIQHPDIDVVGCNYAHINNRGNIKKTISVPKSEDDIYFQLFFTVPFAHPSVMCRESIFRNNRYSESPVEDYLLWTQVYSGNNFANLHETLLLYRHAYGNSFSDKKRMIMIEAEKCLSRSFIQKNITTSKNRKHYSNSIFARAVATTMLNYNLTDAIRLQKEFPATIFNTMFYLLRHGLRVLYWKFCQVK